MIVGKHSDRVIELNLQRLILTSGRTPLKGVLSMKVVFKRRQLLIFLFLFYRKRLKVKPNALTDGHASNFKHGHI